MNEILMPRLRDTSRILNVHKRHNEPTTYATLHGWVSCTIARVKLD